MFLAGRVAPQSANLRAAAEALSGSAGEHKGVKMGTTIKALVIVWLISTAIGLAVVFQPRSDEPIAVSVTSSRHGVKQEEKIVLKAALNGTCLSHGEVKLDFTRTKPTVSVSSFEYPQSIKGYTDGQGLYITSGPPLPPGEYMITASVSKAGCNAGKTVCFLRVPEPRQDRRLADGPVSITLSNRLGR
jgi:hypothetical protein